ncbi:MAG: hypothetical protein KAT39_13540 [Alphaproteobacteria bacterium]|nr:hypothetical protein [Alphaproteobacteria bacterium]
MGFLIRWAFAFGLLAATFNPTQWNYTRWATNNFSGQMPMVVLLGLLLVVSYIIYLRATLHSIGMLGMGLIGAVVVALLWVLYDFGLLSLDNSSINVWIGILALSLVLGVGLSWSFVRRALSGQLDVNDAEE